MDEKDPKIINLQDFLNKGSQDGEKVDELLAAFLDQVEDPEIYEGIDEFEPLYDNEARALDLIIAAHESETFEEYASLVAQAYELDPTDLDIVKDYTLLEYDELEAYPILEDLANDYYKANRTALIRDGYSDYQHRPFIRLKFTLAEYYKDKFLFDKAEKHAKDILKFDKDDHLGTSITLMSIYVRSHQYKKARAFFKSDEFNRNIDTLVFYMLIAAVLDGQDDYAYQLTEELLELNPNLADIFKEADFRSFYYILPQYYPFKDWHYDSLTIVVKDLVYLFEGSSYLYKKIRQNIKEIWPESIPNIGPEFDFKAFRLEEKARKLEGQTIFKGIGIGYLKTLVDAGLESVEDFKKVSRQEVLDLKGIGAKTVEKLEKNGVVFKE